MPYRYIEVVREGSITIITINRPEARNALNEAAHVELETAFDDYAADPAQWCAIVTGSGDKAFCAGHDLKQHASGGGHKTPPTGFGGLTARHDLFKPVIAAVNGVALGGGFEIALACDLIIASPSAQFALPEPRVGIAALAGGLQRLPREIGLKRAMSMVLTGRHVSAAEGVALGFVNDIAVTDLLGVAKRWASEILKCSPMSIRASKEAIEKSLALPVRQAMAEEWNYPGVQALLASEDFHEGAQAFAEKREPQWRGR